VKDKYRIHYENASTQEKISWHILALKAPQEIDSKVLIEKIVTSLNGGTSTFEQEKEILPANCELSISPLFVTESVHISAALKPLLESAEDTVWTAPIQAKEIKNGVVKWTSYQVKERIPGEKIPLSAVEETIRESLVGPVFEAKKKAFIDDLMKKYDVLFTMSETEMETYKPFLFQ
jgi:hypothetical protein